VDHAEAPTARAGGLFGNMVRRQDRHNSVV
jgi:hypothetical protein